MNIVGFHRQAGWNNYVVTHTKSILHKHDWGWVKIWNKKVRSRNQAVALPPQNSHSSLYPPPPRVWGRCRPPASPTPFATPLLREIRMRTDSMDSCLNVTFWENASHSFSNKLFSQIVNPKISQVHYYSFQIIHIYKNYFGKHDRIRPNCSTYLLISKRKQFYRHNECDLEWGTMMNVREILNIKYRYTCNEKHETGLQALLSE